MKIVDRVLDWCLGEEPSPLIRRPEPMTVSKGTCPACKRAMRAKVHYTIIFSMDDVIPFECPHCLTDLIKPLDTDRREVLSLYRWRHDIWRHC